MHGLLVWFGSKLETGRNRGQPVARQKSRQPAMSEFTVRTRKFQNNPLLGRKQFVLDAIHPGMANVSKKDLAEKLRSMYKVHDVQCIQLFSFKTAFGGGRSSGFGLIYENIEKLKKFEPKYRLKRTGLGGEKSGPGRRAKKDTKNRMKKARGKDKAKAGSKKWEKVQETQEPLDPHGKTSHELARMDWRQFRFRSTCNPAGSCRSIPIIHVKVFFSQLSNWTSMVPASSLGFVYQTWCI